MHGYAQNTRLSVGQEFLHYKVKAVIGQGAMGIVYKVYDKKRSLHVALKILQAHFISEKQHRKFIQEVKAIAKLNHENIVKLFDVGTQPTYYFTMEYVEGRTLGQFVNNEDIDFVTLGKIMHKISIALYHAHVKGIIHGDIKPQNIVIDKNDEPKIMDFGLAKNRRDVTDDHTSLEGTPAYLSPEQLQHRVVDKRSDIYSFGITLYYCLTKQLPFAEKNYAALFYQIVHRDPQKPREINAGVPQELEEVCLKCIQRNAQLRYANAKFLAHDLLEFVEGKPLTKKILQKINKSSRLFYVEVLLVFTVIILTVVYSVLPSTTFERKSALSAVDTDYSWHNHKSKALLAWYRGQSYHLHHLQLLSQRLGFIDELWKKDAQKAIDGTYNQIHQSGVVDLELAVQLVESVIVMQQSEYIDDRFYRLCNTALKAAKKRDLQVYVDKFKQFSELYKVIEQLRLLGNQHEKDLSAKYKEEKRIIITAMQKITNSYGRFYLACQSHDIWLREKLLVDAVNEEDNDLFYGKLGEFYISNNFYHEGIALFRHQLQRNPYSPSAHYHIARGLTFVGDYENALRHIEFLEKNYFNIGKELIFIEKTRIFTIQKKYSMAKEALEDARAWVSYYGKSLGNFEFEHWQKFISGDLSFEAGFSAEEKVRWYYRVGEWEKAYKLLEETESLPLRLAIYRAILNEKLRKFDTAEQIWKEAYDLVTRNLRREQQEKTLFYSPLLYRYAFEFLIGRHGDFYKSYVSSRSQNRQLLDRVGKTLEEYYFTSLYRARFLKNRGAYSQVIVLCNRAKQLAPWYRREIELMEKISLARWYYFFDKKNMEVGRKIAEEMVSDDDYGPAHNLLGAINIHENISQAQYHFTQIIPRQLSIPDLLDFYFDRAYFYAQQQHYDNAIDDIEKYLKLNPDFIYAKRALRSFREKRGR